jgi:DNA-binding response OmpR family regulator
MIESHVWNFDFVSGSNVVDVYIRRLRRKIDDPYPQKVLETVRGVGYRLLRDSGARGDKAAKDQAGVQNEGAA